MRADANQLEATETMWLFRFAVDVGKYKVAEREGFEPSIRFCRILTFQASAFDHSATAPHIAGRPVI